MRLTDLRYFVGLLFLLPTGAQELSPSSSPKISFRTNSIGRGELIRGGGNPPTPRRFVLPEGGQELGLRVTTSTPYDSYFGSVRAVLAALNPQPASMARACHLMKVGHSFQYTIRDPYRPDPPKLTEAQRAGDCKSKALWLFGSLADSGALFVVGKVETKSRNSHAWVYWRNDGQWWILDCTNRTDPIAASSVSADRYIPYYSFGKTGVYRHPRTRSNGSTGDNAPVVGSPGG